MFSSSAWPRWMEASLIIQSSRPKGFVNRLEEGQYISGDHLEARIRGIHGVGRKTYAHLTRLVNRSMAFSIDQPHTPPIRPPHFQSMRDHSHRHGPIP